MQVGVAVYRFVHLLFCRMPEGSMMMGVANVNIPVGILSQDSVVVPILGVSHQEFVQKV